MILYSVQGGKDTKRISVSGKKASYEWINRLFGLKQVLALFTPVPSIYRHGNRGLENAN